MATTYEVGTRLVELCKAGEHRRAIEELYADEVDVQEAMAGGPKPNGVQTRAELLAGAEMFTETNEIHDATTEGPHPIGDRFVCFMSIDLTPKAGPMAGTRFQMSEACIYTVRDGKIVRSEFAYHVPESLGDCG